MVSETVTPRIHPSYFSLGCEHHADMSGITITPYADFKSYISETLEVLSVCERIVGCVDAVPPMVKDGCFCSACVADVYEPVTNEAGKIVACNNVGCQPGGQHVVNDCSKYEEKVITSREDCKCESCTENFLLDPGANTCSKCDDVDQCEKYATDEGRCECYQCKPMDHCVSFRNVGSSSDAEYTDCKTCDTCDAGYAPTGGAMSNCDQVRPRPRGWTRTRHILCHNGCVATQKCEFSGCGKFKTNTCTCETCAVPAKEMRTDKGCFCPHDEKCANHDGVFHQV